MKSPTLFLQFANSYFHLPDTPRKDKVLITFK
jgi:hypothetical protein